MPVKNLDEGTSYIKATYWKGEALKGTWHVTFKIDGIRALKNKDGQIVSRNNKPLYNLDHLDIHDAEIFRTDWNTSMSLCRTQSHDTHVTQGDVYDLRPGLLDPRLTIGTVTDPTEASINRLLRQALALGYEGLVLRSMQTPQVTSGKFKPPQWRKVVPELFADVRITGWEQGKTGKNIGRFGAFVTAHGKVGTGFSDEFRDMPHDELDDMVGKIIQVGYRELTANGKLRFPRFDRYRFDKDEESI